MWTEEDRQKAYEERVRREDARARYAGAWGAPYYGPSTEAYDIAKYQRELMKPQEPWNAPTDPTKDWWKL